jgi:FKBP-type peptidyl-prolyl cis-trans isomerase FklB
MKKQILVLAAFSFMQMAQAQTSPKSVTPATKAVTTVKPATPVKAVPAQALKVGNAKSQMNVTPPLTIKNGKDSASYALGYRIAQSLNGQGLQKINLAVFNKGLLAGFEGKSIIIDSLLDYCIKTYQETMSAEKSAANKLAGQEFLVKNAKKPGVVSLPNGIQYEILVAGKDTIKPTIKDKVRCHYHGTLIDGSIFDSSVQRGEPITFPLNGVIKGWQESLPLMSIGSKWRLFIPAELGYGDRQAGPMIGPGSTLIFEVELLGIE